MGKFIFLKSRFNGNLLNVRLNWGIFYNRSIQYPVEVSGNVTNNTLLHRTLNNTVISVELHLHIFWEPYSFHNPFSHSSMCIRNHRNLENFHLKYFDKLRRFGMSLIRFDYFSKLSVCLCMTQILVALTQELTHGISSTFIFN